MTTHLRAGFGLLTALSILCTAAPTLAATTPFSNAPFTDVPTTSPFYTSIEYFRQQNLIRGYADGTFKPDQQINRAEFAYFITNPFFLNTDVTNNCVSDHETDKIHIFFFDVQKDSWYANAVCAAQIKDIIDGYSDGSYRPGNPINFAEAAKIVVNTFVADFANPDKSSDHWYKQYVDKLSDLKAIPTSIKTAAHYMTRAEMVELIYRVKLNNTMKTSTNGQDVR